MAGPRRGSPRETSEEYWKKFADKLIEQIEKGTAPWQKSWARGERHTPENVQTGRPYQGGNVVVLMAEAAAKGYGDNRWGTYRQIGEAGGQVREGEKATRIVFYKSLHEDGEEPRPGSRDARGGRGPDRDRPGAEDESGRSRVIAMRFAAFNLEQAEGLEHLKRPGAVPEWEANAAAEAALANGAPIRHVNGDRAYYNLREDRITLPERSQFNNSRDYYLTALHEAGHSTGHADKLNRETLHESARDGFGSPAYAREELRAEIAAMMTGDKIGMGHEPQHGAAYVKGWVGALKDDPAEIRRASADAARISDYLVPERERERNGGPERGDGAGSAGPKTPERPGRESGAAELVPAVAVQGPERDMGRGR